MRRIGGEMLQSFPKVRPHAVGAPEATARFPSGLPIPNIVVRAWFSVWTGRVKIERPVVIFARPFVLIRAAPSIRGYVGDLLLPWHALWQGGRTRNEGGEPFLWRGIASSGGFV